MSFAAALVLAQTAGAALPRPWLDADIGPVGLAGTGTASSGTFTVSGAGADIWGNADAFHYTYQRLNGNTQIIARISSIQNTNVWAKAGVMIRETLSPSSKHATMVITPGNGASFQSRAIAGNVSVSAATAGITAPRWVKLTRSGNQFAAYFSADGIAWTQVGAARSIEMDPVVYVGLAVTSHNAAAVCAATIADVSLNAPPVLFVTASTMLNAGDAAIKKRMEALGYAVTVKDAASSATADANGKDLVLVSSTVASGSVAAKFRTVTTPVILWESALLDDMGMTGTVSGADYGTATAQAQATIFPTACNRATMYTAAVGYGDGCQDMAAGLSGTVAILNAAGTVSWGKPGANAIKIAYQPGFTDKSLVFGYDKGAVMPGLTAPGRRVFLYLEDNTATSWTGRGQALFDNAVYWATGSKYYLTRKALVLNYDPLIVSQGNQRLDVYGKTRWNWHDPLVLARDYLADITEATGGYIRWKWAHYADIPDYLNAWVPITGPQQFNSATFTEADYFNGYNIGPTTGDWGAAGRAMPNNGNYYADYQKILDNYGVNAKVTNGEVDEVIIYSPPFAGFNESAMAGSTAYEINGPIIPRPTPNFMVMGLNYERGLGEALESFGHRVEWFLDRHAYGIPETVPYNPCYWPDFPHGAYCGDVLQPTPVRNIYDRFTVVEGNLPGQAGVGAAHWAPNAGHRTDEYNWGIATTAYSMCDDWQNNYPSLIGLGSKRLVNIEEWRPMAQDGDPGRGFKKWWFQHMPRIPGHYRDAANAANDGKLNNWWEYVFNFNKHPETRLH